jgi:hypothetical protein
VDVTGIDAGFDLMHDSGKGSGMGGVELILERFGSHVFR